MLCSIENGVMIKSNRRRIAYDILVSDKMKNCKSLLSFARTNIFINRLIEKRLKQGSTKMKVCTFTITKDPSLHNQIHQNRNDAIKNSCQKIISHLVLMAA